MCAKRRSAAAFLSSLRSANLNDDPFTGAKAQAPIGAFVLPGRDASRGVSDLRRATRPSPSHRRIEGDQNPSALDPGWQARRSSLPGPSSACAMRRSSSRGAGLKDVKVETITESLALRTVKEL